MVHDSVWESYPYFTIFIQYDGIKQKMTFACKDLFLLNYYTKDVNNYYEEEHKWYKEKKSWGHL